MTKQDKLITIKEVPLKNNCPECYNNEGLQLTFKQRFIETSFYRQITNEIEHVIFCNTCDSTIYPVQWDEHIERVVAYQKKAFIPKPTSRKLKKPAYIILAVLGLIIVTSVIISLLIYKGL
jgi:DNA-directed RNA polymerase subunit M/transcription elongation factor TFIIS